MPEMTSSTETDFLGVKVPRQLKERLQRVAAAEDRSVSSVVRRALESALADHPITDPRVRPGGDASRFEGGRR